MTDLKRSKITEIANEIIIEDEEYSHSQLKKASPTPTGTYAIFIALILLITIIFLIFNSTTSELEPELTAIKTDISANNTSDIKAIVVDPLPPRELPIVPQIEYEVTEIKKKHLK
ncbi:hypothetical protein ACLKMH_21915 [Psychromonas sp. KJ10-10]|uniref:hypothetical protein n=1 Tax=Psychromonas sp. KJ10-10 TaxID=3391823 RepID=UPI0039B53361